MASTLAIVFDLLGFFRLSVYFTVVFGGANVLFWWFARGRRPTRLGLFWTMDHVFAWILAILSVITSYWLAAQTGFEVVSVAGILFGAYFAFVGVVASLMKWDGGCLLLFLFGMSLVVCTGIAALDNYCALHHGSFPWNRLGCSV